MWWQQLMWHVPCIAKRFKNKPYGHADDKARYPGWGMDGQALHCQEHGVPPEKWCITKEDLLLLRHEIQTAIQAGKIIPTERDPFDPEDNRYGPNMYNVVESYIKPLSDNAGGMSWALMRHPEGLPCDIFITHCWAEGAFEFIDKLIASWPKNKKIKHAWCCIFANPQTLDIGHLIRDPRTSPFAVALRKSSQMMVVSTRNVSIYSRIWCAYEAYLATSEERTIFVARRQRGCWLVNSGVLVACICSAKNGVLAADRPWFTWAIIFGCHLIECFYCYQARKAEAVELQSNYSSLLEAEASNPDDKVHILNDIGENIQAVEKSVGLILTAGISTPYLRRAAQRGAEAWGAADPSLPIITCYAWISSVLAGEEKGVDQAVNVTLLVFNIVLMVLTCTLHRRGELGEKAFISAVMTKLCLVTTAIYLLVLLPLNHITDTCWTCLPLKILLLVVGGLAFACSFAGMPRIARIPVVGPQLAGALGPGWSWMFAACFNIHRMPRAAGLRRTACWLAGDLSQSCLRRSCLKSRGAKSPMSDAAEERSASEIEEESELDSDTDSDTASPPDLERRGVTASV